MAHIDLLDDKTWEGVSPEAQADFLRGGEEMVKSTLSLGHGADFRAVTMMGIFATLGVALFAAVATLFAGANPFWPAIIAGVATGSGLFVAAGFCAAAAWPGEFFVAGFEPRNLINSSAKQDQFRDRVLIAVIQDRIDDNRRAIAHGARLVMIAIWIAAITLPGGGAALIALSVAGGHRPAGTADQPAFATARAPAAVPVAGASAGVAAQVGASVHQP
jgi:hypothetical protein